MATYIKSIIKLNPSKVTEEISQLMLHLQQDSACITRKGVLDPAKKLAWIKSKECNAYSSELSKNIANMYLNKDYIAENLKETDTLAGVQTYIRSVFHDYKKPEELQFLEINELKKTLRKSAFIKQTPTLFAQIKSLENDSDIFFMVTDVIESDNPNSQLNIAKSFTKIKKDTPIKLFASLLEAIEYAYSLDKIFSADSPRDMPSIWAITHKKMDISQIKYETIVADEDQSSSCYNFNEHYTEISFFETTKENVSPIIGAIITPQNKFGKFQVSQTVEGNKIEEIIRNANQSKCFMM